ncbi:MAG TPA: hypothetical protein ENK58_08785 [Desulfobacterales bacterium]|nr:hypothetical protein [Desulfobacterales bacterium]
MGQPTNITFKFKDLLKRPGSLRQIGQMIRTEIVNQWANYEIVELDFENETVASGSLFDEIAKLFLEYPKEEVKRRLRLINIDPWDERLIVHLVKLRLDQRKKAS